MGKNDGDNRGKGGRGGRPRGRRGGRNRSRREPPVRESIRLVCIRCGEAIGHPEMAIASPESGEPMHFDCAISEIADKEDLGAREKICYLGQGNFAVVSYKSGSTERDFSVKKIIPYENREKETEWRRSMRDKATAPR
jgi:hypothetical protein